MTRPSLIRLLPPACDPGNRRARFGPALLVLAAFLFLPVSGAIAESSLADKAAETKESIRNGYENAKESVQDTSRAVADGFEDFWKGFDSSRLKNRTRDEIVAWVIMGVIVGCAAGMMTAQKSSGMKKAGFLALGLVGASAGGMIVRGAKVDFGWGYAVISYEELLFSLAGAFALVLAWRMIRSGGGRKKQARE